VNLNSCKFVIFGVRKNYTTHTHIHEAFYRILKYAGREVYWVDTASELDNVDLDNTFFISEGHHTDIPILADAFYAIHNLEDNPCEPVLKNVRNKFANWGMFDQSGTAGIKNVRGPYMALDPFSRYYPESNKLFLHWATDLTPEEIQANKTKAKLLNETSNRINWVGYVWPKNDLFTNYKQLTSFERACHEQNIEFIPYGIKGRGVVSIEENIRLVRESYFAPALLGTYQVDAHYVPCRIFKNISYGQFGVTNSPTVNEFFGGNLICNMDCYQLFYDAKEQLPTKMTTELYELMDFVAEHHTYVNRINVMLQAAKIIL